MHTVSTMLSVYAKLSNIFAFLSFTIILSPKPLGFASNPAPLIVQPATINNSKNPLGLKELVEDNYISTNIRGGNPKFGYIPPKNYREILIYQFSQFKKKPNAQELMSIMSQFPYPKRKKRNTNIFQEIQDLEMSAFSKRIIPICKWAKSLPSPMDKVQICSRDELKSILKIVNE